MHASNVFIRTKKIANLILQIFENYIRIKKGIKVIGVTLLDFVFALTFSWFDKVGRLILLLNGLTKVTKWIFASVILLTWLGALGQRCQANVLTVKVT